MLSFRYVSNRPPWYLFPTKIISIHFNYSPTGLKQTTNNFLFLWLGFEGCQFSVPDRTPQRVYKGNWTGNRRMIMRWPQSEFEVAVMMTFRLTFWAIGVQKENRQKKANQFIQSAFMKILINLRTRVSSVRPGNDWRYWRNGYMQKQWITEYATIATPSTGIKTVNVIPLFVCCFFDSVGAQVTVVPFTKIEMLMVFSF